MSNHLYWEPVARKEARLSDKLKFVLGKRFYQTQTSALTFNRNHIQYFQALCGAGGAIESFDKIVVTLEN